MAALQSRRCAKASTGAGAPATRSVPLHRYLPALPLGLDLAFGQGASCTQSTSPIALSTLWGAFMLADVLS